MTSVQAAIAALVAEYGVEQARLEQFKELFDMFDVSGDNLIDVEEFTFAIRCINKDATPNQIGDWMLLGDPDATGEIRFIDFCKVLLELRKRLDRHEAPAELHDSPARRAAVRQMLGRFISRDLPGLP